MKHVILGMALLVASTICSNPEVERIGSEIQGMNEKKVSCEEQVKMLQQQIAELTEKIARAQSALEVKKVQVQQTLPPTPVTQAPTAVTVAA